MNESQIRLIVLLKIFPFLFVGLICLVILAVECSNDTDPMDNSIMKSIEYVEHLDVLDNKFNGFQVTFVTKEAVTKERLREIQSRQNIQKAFLKMRREAVVHFCGSLLYVDIHEFARFVREYDYGNQIKIHCVNVQGSEKMNHYIGPNPRIQNSARWMDVILEQGNQWINSNDVYSSSTGVSNTYRYWKCSYPNETSETDEHFSHFSEEDRIK